jgi:uncharacterized protein YjiS (DUF1127 family)
MSNQIYADFAGFGTAAARPPRAKPILAAIYGLQGAVRRHVAARRARRELYALPDVMLSDLGISRSDVASVARHGWSDPTRLPRG